MALTLPIHWALGQESRWHLLKFVTVSIIYLFNLLCPALFGYWGCLVSKWIPLPSNDALMGRDQVMVMVGVTFLIPACC